MLSHAALHSDPSSVAFYCECAHALRAQRTKHALVEAAAQLCGTGSFFPYFFGFHRLDSGHEARAASACTARAILSALTDLEILFNATGRLSGPAMPTLMVRRGTGHMVAL